MAGRRAARGDAHQPFDRSTALDRGDAEAQLAAGVRRDAGFDSDDLRRAFPITPGDLGIIEVGLTGALVAFGGASAPVVAAVLVYRVLSTVPTLVLGAIAGLSWHRLDAPPARAAARP